MTLINQSQYDTPKEKTYSSFDTSFTTGDSPTTLDINSTLSRNAIEGYIVNNGPGRLTYQISEDGTNYDSSINLEPQRGHNLRAISMDSIKVTWVADTSYEVVAW